MAPPGTLPGADCEDNGREVQGETAMDPAQFQFALTESHSHGDRADSCMQYTLIVSADLILSPCR